MRTNFIKAWLMPCLTMALLSMAFVGCNEQGTEDAAPKITIAEESIVLAKEANSKAQIAFEANCDWVVSTDASQWISMNPRKGSKNGVVTVTATRANTQVESREAFITITHTGGKAEAKVKVVQMGQGATVEISDEDAVIEVANEVGAQQGFTITSNVEWTAAKSGDWFDVEEQESGSRTAVIVTVTGYNETLEARTGTYTINYKDGEEDKSVVVTISQAACVPALSAEPEAVVFPTIEAATQTFTLTAAGPWTLTAPEWATVSATEGNSGEVELTVSVEKNTQPKELKGEIVVTSTLDEKVVLKVAVSQAGNEPKISAVEAVEIPCSAGEVALTFSTNYAWSATAMDTWIELSENEGNAGENTITIKYAANTPDAESKGAERSATIILTCTHPDDKTLSTTANVKVNQAEFDGYDLSEVESANCYITTQKGVAYKFDATVRGNGQADQEMYIDVQPISMDEDDMQAIELWRDNQAEIITDITLNKETGYISFKVKENAPNGNVVIALATLDEFDYTIVNKVFWSWHIWVNSEDIEAKAMPITYPEFTSGPTVPVTLMDRNLGALINGRNASLTETQYGMGGVQDSYGMHYEWGRKDPFPGCNEAFSPYRDAEMTTYLGSTRYQLWRTVDGVATDVTSIFNGTSMGSVYNEAVNNGETPDELTSINYAIANPTIYITGGNAGDAYADVTGVDENGEAFTGARNLPSTWFFVPETLRNGSGFYHEWSWPTYLWGNSNNGYTNYGQKTIYDPCPPGWRVPDNGTFNFFVPYWSSSPLRKDEESGQIYKHMNVKGEITWSLANDADRGFGAGYVYDPMFKEQTNQAYNPEFKAGFEVYTGGYQAGETMFFPMSGQLSYDSGRPESDYSGWGSSASYALNAQNSYKQYISRLEIYAPSGNITESWQWNYETKVHSFPGAAGSPNSSFHPACGFSVRCMKDVAPELEEGGEE